MPVLNFVNTGGKSKININIRDSYFAILAALSSADKML